MKPVSAVEFIEYTYAKLLEKDIDCVILLSKLKENHSVVTKDLAKRLSEKFGRSVESWLRFNDQSMLAKILHDEESIND